MQISASFTGVFYESEWKRTQGCGWKAGKTQLCAQGVTGTGQKVGGENAKEGVFQGAGGDGPDTRAVCHGLSL